jgi:hypothetical protein
MRLLPWSTLFIKFANHDLSENSTCLGVWCVRTKR